MLKEFVARHLRLERRGRIWWGLCPFHPDRHPSLAIYDDDEGGHYHCFACGAHGTALTWLMRYEKLSFHEAKKRLGGEWTPSPRKRPDLTSREALAWPEPGVEYEEVALLRERLVLSRWSDEQVLFSLWSSAPQLSNEQLRLLHPHAQDLVLDRLRKIYPKS